MISLTTTLALVHGLHLAATLSLPGTVGFIAWTLRGRVLRIIAKAENLPPPPSAPDGLDVATPSSHPIIG